MKIKNKKLIQRRTAEKKRNFENRRKRIMDQQREVRLAEKEKRFKGTRNCVIGRSGGSFGGE